MLDMKNQIIEKGFLSERLECLDFFFAFRVLYLERNSSESSKYSGHWKSGNRSRENPSDRCNFLRGYSSELGQNFV